MNICDKCANNRCMFNQGIERTKCDFFQEKIPITYQSILNDAKQVIDTEAILDYRPAHFMDGDVSILLPKAIRMWLKNGDQIIYIKKE